MKKTWTRNLSTLAGIYFRAALGRFRQTTAKKKLLSRYGKIEISHASAYSMRGSLFGITPYMQEQITWSGQLLVFEDASEMLRRTLRVVVSDSQIFRVSESYGMLVSGELEREPAEVEVAQDDVLYVQADGSMIQTDKGYKETKVGRTFRQSDCRTKVDKEDRGMIMRSDYIAQLTDSESFIKLAEPRLSPYAYLRERMVFISDGSTWLDNWIEEYYPYALRILDFFHLAEWLSKAAAGCYKQEEEARQWVEKQKDTLFEQDMGILKVLEELKKLEAKSSAAQEQLNATINYVSNNLHRTNYKAYRQKGLFIGSGAIESAHRTLIQDRMKRSGQVWSISGANAIINLRVCNKSQRWHKVVDEIKLMNTPALKKAA
jgi:Uncharacterised protein family (UPF0236)